MHLLVISWWYPPWNESPSGRPASWARNWAEAGHRVTVLTCRKSPELHGDLSQEVPVHPNLEVVEVPVPLDRVRWGKKITWMLAAIPAVRRHAAAADVIVSSFMPWHVHVLGRLGVCVQPAATWCADYRDLWSDFDYFTDTRPLKKRFMRGVERALVRSADLATTVSPPLARTLAGTLESVPCRTIYNGFPMEELREVDAAARLASRLAEGATFRILYAGTIYPGYHDPEPLFAALGRLRDRFVRPVRLSFYGRCRTLPLLRELASRHGVEELVELPDRYLGRAECLDLQHEADLLLHLSWTNRAVDGVLSGKVFEYIASGAPSLSIGSEPDTAIGRLLDETGTGRCVGLDVDAVAETLEVMVNEGRLPDWFRPDRERILEYSRERQAARLLDEISRVRRGAHDAAIRTGDKP